MRYYYSQKFDLRKKSSDKFLHNLSNQKITQIGWQTGESLEMGRCHQNVSELVSFLGNNLKMYSLKSTIQQIIIFIFFGVE